MPVPSDTDAIENAQTKDFCPEPVGVPSRLPRDAAYLIQQVGPSLTKALAEIVEKQPRDPIEYLSQYLYKHADTLEYLKKVRQF